MPCYTCGVVGGCGCAFPIPPMPVQFFRTSGLITKPSLCEAAEQVVFPIDNAGRGTAAGGAMGALQALAQLANLRRPGCPGPLSLRNAAQTFGVGMCGSTVVIAEPVGAAGSVTSFTFLVDPCAIAVDAPVCAVEITVVVKGMATVEPNPGVEPSQQTLVFCDGVGLCGRSPQTVTVNTTGYVILYDDDHRIECTAFLRYRFLDC